MEQREVLTEQELMRLILLPLAEKGKEDKQKRIMQVIELADKMENEDEQKLVLSGLLVISDKFIDRENMEEIRRRFGMTKIGRSIYENGMEEGREEGREEGKRAEKRKTAEKMLRRGEDMAFIMELTDLTEEEIKEIEEGMLVSQ